MAYHFSANQYDDKYNPKKLGNWEYPKWYPERPRQRFKATKFIADDNGRLLDGIKKENPWGNFVGTWDLPKRITRDYVKQITAPPEKLVSRWEKKKEPREPELKKDSQLSKEFPVSSKEKLTEELKQQEVKEGKKPEEEMCSHCMQLLKDCICEKNSRSNSSEGVEKCDESLYCPKCHNEICLCENGCHCVNQE